MVTLQIMDNIFYEAQRQGRLSFYATTIGEEAINIASAAALNPQDVIFPQVLFFNHSYMIKCTLIYIMLLHIDHIYVLLDESFLQYENVHVTKGRLID